MNQLASENCNKAKCKTCMFRPDGLKLSAERMNEINAYLVTFKASHVCHTTNLTCYGALELQAKVAFALRIIPEPTVQSFLQTAKTTLGL